MKSETEYRWVSFGNYLIHCPICGDSLFKTTLKDGDRICECRQGHIISANEEYDKETEILRLSVGALMSDLAKKTFGVQNE